MNLLVIPLLADSGRSSNSVANRMSDRNFDVIDFIRDASRADEMQQAHLVM
jgi:putative NADH-flavin reductase